jgi:hypothetical protein
MKYPIIQSISRDSTYLQLEVEKSSTNSMLSETQEALDKTRAEVSAQHVNITRLIGHVAALQTLHVNAAGALNKVT